MLTRIALAPGSEELCAIYDEHAPSIASNDSCGASGYAPLSPTERMHQLALALLDRHGVLVRESVMAASSARRPSRRSACRRPRAHE